MNRDRIGKYQILGELGRGTMGEVYRALDPVLHREVALKTLSVRVGPDEDALGRFQREARAAAGLNHPNIVTIHEFGDDGGVLYIAMELLKGTDLRDAIDTDSLRSLDEKLAVMDAVLSGLDYAHARDVIHRDIKPANIHLGPGGLVKIMDFGLARDKYSDLTQDGIVVGTPNYMSPEQALGERVDARSDLFSTGAVLYELLTGHKPFEADSTPSVLFQVVHREAPSVRRWTPGVPEPIVAVVERALIKDRARRFESAAQMRQALLEAARVAHGDLAPSLSSRDSSAARPSLPPSASRSGAGRRRGGSGRTTAARARRSSPLPAVVGAGLVVALLAVGATLWLTLANRRPPEAPRGRSDQQVGELTRALVATQVQLAQRELQDKNWAAAVAQAESALRLAPGHPEAMRSLNEARERLAELDQAIVAARERLAAGDTEGASLQLSHLLELDPRHPAAAELSARLNDVFRSQSEAAAASMRKARDEARAAGAADSREFRGADTTAREALDLAEREEFADATRNFLEARDAFDRARRAARESVSASASAAGPETSARPSPSSGSRRESDQAAAGRDVSPLSARATPAASAPTPLPPPRAFVADKTTVTTPSAGALAGFETEDVRTRRQPRFVGHMVFEVLPPEVRPGEPFVVRVHLVNEGKKTVRVRGIELSTIVHGARTSAPARPLSREVAARSRALVAEFSSTWTETGSWALEAVVLADDDEQVRCRLTAD
jgi:eukaryotic-like serine/threonine-protein kinase